MGSFMKCLTAVVLICFATVVHAGTSVNVDVGAPTPAATVDDCCPPVVQQGVPQVVKTLKYVPRTVTEIQQVERTRMVPETYVEEVCVEKTVFDVVETEEVICNYCPTTTGGVVSQGATPIRTHCVNNLERIAPTTNANLAAWYAHRAYDEAKEEKRSLFQVWKARKAAKRTALSVD